MSFHVLPAKPNAPSVSAQLNRECFCVTLDRDELRKAFTRAVDDTDFCDSLFRSHPHLFSRTPVFVPERDIARMHGVVRAIESATRLPGYQSAALSWAPEIARRDFGPLGAFMGYDFHLSDDGPKLIEINTNAGGAFLNAVLAQAQRACCVEAQAPSTRSAASFDDAVARMFRNEWTLQRQGGSLRRMAIIDDRPEAQYLYPEFILAKRVLLRLGIETVIADARELIYERGELRVSGMPIDLVYNRLVDFALDEPDHKVLRAAYADGAVVVTPNPRVHALFADKRNLSLLCDADKLRDWGLAPDMIVDLAAVPHTSLVTPEEAAPLWQARRRLFFKPAGGHGSKAVYRGDKLTKGVWAEILRGGYVAQDFAAPSERVIEIDGAQERRKADFRLYVYDGQILLTAARLYQGQTTNFRTPGGGFAPVFVI